MEALPEVVRTRIVAFGSQTLDRLSGEDIPTAVRPIARFTPAKRAKLGASAIAATVDSDANFRRHVLETASKALPGMVEALDDGTPPAAADPADVGAVAYLLRPDGWRDLVGHAARQVEKSQAAAQHERGATVVARLREQLEATRSSARETRERFKRDTEQLKDENTTLRRKLHEARQQVATAESARDEAVADAEQARSAAELVEKAAEAEGRRLRARLAEIEDALGSAKRSGRGERDLVTARLSMLLDVLADVSAGLRRELALPASSLLPADTVDAVEAGVLGAQARAQASDDPKLLDDLLALPRAHLVVDGYNVTKAAWSSMPLEGQRARLIRGLAAVAARSAAEVTVVFDGADVTVPPAATPAQGVRVRFSPHGTTADDVIRSLVAAEPEGRPVVVVSSDREVADGVRRPGVRPMKSVALERLLR